MQSPPTILIFVPVTVPLNFAEPAFVVVPIVIVSAATLPENVITAGAPSALLNNLNSCCTVIYDISSIQLCSRRCSIK